VDEEGLRRREARDDDNDNDNGGGEPVNPRLGVSDLSTNRRRSVMFDAAVVFYAPTKRCASPSRRYTVQYIIRSEKEKEKR